jgi:superfamily II DNA/RNA helicase
MRKIKVVVLDDIDKLIEAGTEQQILEVIRHVPSLAQIVASSTSFSLSISSVVSKLLADPLQVLVNRNEGIIVGSHFYIRVPEEEKLNALCTIFSTIGGEGFVVLCQDSAKLKVRVLYAAMGYFYIQVQIDWSEQVGCIISKLLLGA